MSLWFTRISRNVAQPAKKAMTCQGMKTGAHVWHCDVGSMSSESFGLLGGCGWGLFLQHIWQMLDSTGIWTDHSRSGLFVMCCHRVSGWVMCMWHAQICHCEHCMLTIIHITCSLFNAVAHVKNRDSPSVWGLNGCYNQNLLGVAVVIRSLLWGNGKRVQFAFKIKLNFYCTLGCVALVAVSQPHNT